MMGTVSFCPWKILTNYSTSWLVDFVFELSVSVWHLSLPAQDIQVGYYCFSMTTSLFGLFFFYFVV